MTGCTFDTDGNRHPYVGWEEDEDIEELDPRAMEFDDLYFLAEALSNDDDHHHALARTLYIEAERRIDDAAELAHSW